MRLAFLILFLAGSRLYASQLNGLDPKVIGVWHLNEDEGTFTEDATGNGAGGVLTSGPIWITGKFGSGLSFPAPAALRRVVTDVAQEGKFDFTVNDDFYMVCFAKFRSDRTDKAIIGKAATCSSQGWGICQQTQGFVAIRVRENGTADCLVGWDGLGAIPAIYDDNKFHLVIGSWHNTGVCSTSAKLWVDTSAATLDGSTGFPVTITNDVAVNIGGNSAGAAGVDVDECGIFRGLMTDDLQARLLRRFRQVTQVSDDDF